MATSLSGRMAWVDLIKGISVVLVVLMHAALLLHSPPRPYSSHIQRSCKGHGRRRGGGPWPLAGREQPPLMLRHKWHANNF